MVIYILRREEVIKMSEEPYKRYATGLAVVKSKNSNFNSDFTGSPRRLPDEEGTIYATDKALKYTIRKYLKDNGENVFAWRRKKDDGNPVSIDENYKMLFGEKGLPSRNEIINRLLECTDVRLFGITFAPGEEGKNVSITGPVQISYGLNRYTENLHYTNQILSPYQPKEKGSTTIGEEAKSLEVHYVFDFTINPNHLTDAIKEVDPQGELSEDDVVKFKKAACHGVTAIDSTSMIGTENELLVFIECDQPFVLQNLKDFVKIRNGEGEKRICDFGYMGEYLSSVNKELNLEVYYDPYKTEIDGLDKIKSTEVNINTWEKING